MKSTKSGFIVPLLIVIIAVLVIGGGVYVYNQNLKLADTEKPIQNVSTNDKVSSDTQINTPVINWKIYTNTVYGFTIKYPSDWIAQPNIDTGRGGEDFCPPELLEGTSCKLQPPRGSLMAGPYTLAPIKFFSADPHFPSGTFKVLMKDNAGNSLGLYLSDSKYLSVYNQMLSSFKKIETQSAPPPQVTYHGCQVNFTIVGNATDEMTYSQYVAGTCVGLKTEVACKAKSDEYNIQTQAWGKDGVPDCVWK